LLRETRIHLKFQVGGRDAGAAGDERLHGGVLKDGIIGGVVGVDEEIGLIVGREGDVDGAGIVTEVNLGERECDLVRNR